VREKREREREREREKSQREGITFLYQNYFIQIEAGCKNY
jgi:hypothetical protein